MSDTQISADQPRSIVALIGRPNVGKSTLFNRLTRSRKAIVAATPGVTIDRHYDRVTWNDHTFMLVDTGGIDTAQDNIILARMLEQTKQAISEADIVIFMLDAKSGPTPADHEIAVLLRRHDKPTYYVVNKIDGPEAEPLVLPQFYELGVNELWALSADHGYGLNTFMDNLTQNLLQADNGERYPANTIRLACFGRPNVGKSSLINRMLGEERMVVSDIPGTTRDSVDTLLQKGRRHYLLIDTAGIRRKGKVREKLEKFSIIRALATLERCDIVLLLIDAEEGITDQDTKVIGYSQDQGRACILVVNKWDLVEKDKKRQKHILKEVTMATPFVGFAPVLTTSALTGVGVGKLFPTVSAVHAQYTQTFPTNRVNQVLRKAVEDHPPAIYRGRRLKFYYTTQISTKPPTFAIVTNYPKGVHFSYHRFLVNKFREGLGLDKVPIKIVLRERKRNQ